MNEHIKNWQELVEKQLTAMKDGNIEEADKLMEMAQEEYQKYRDAYDEQISYMESKNFGIANKIFEDVLPELYLKGNTSDMKRIINTIREDKNLLSQYRFYDAMKKYNGVVNSVDYVNECLSLIKEGIDKQSISRSNDNFASLLKECDIIGESKINDDEKEYFDNCNYILTTKKTLSNINEINDKIQKIGEYLNKKKNVSNISEENKKENFFTIIERFEKKYDKLLNESEKELFKDIIGNNSNKKAEQLFDRLKNECLNSINKMINESSEDDKESLNSIKEEITNKQYCSETITKDIAKLLEIRDILLEK